MSSDEAILLAIESIISLNEDEDKLSSIKISVVDVETQTHRFLTQEEIKTYYDKLNLNKAN